MNMQSYTSIYVNMQCVKYAINMQINIIGPGSTTAGRHQWHACVFVRACVRACVRHGACVRASACVRLCFVRACVAMYA